MQPLLTIVDHAGRCLWCQANVKAGDPHEPLCWFHPVAAGLVEKIANSGSLTLPPLLPFDENRRKAKPKTFGGAA